MSRVSFIGILSCLTCANGSRQHISSLTFHLNKMYDLALNTAVKVTETVAQLLTGNKPDRACSGELFEM